MYKTFIFITALMFTSILHAEPVSITTTKSSIQGPCLMAIKTAVEACTITDVTYEASPPRGDLVISKMVAKPIVSKHNNIAIIYRYKASSRYFNKDAVITIWDVNNNFVAEFKPKPLKSVILYYTSSNGGKTWSKIQSLNKEVSFTIDY